MTRRVLVTGARGMLGSELLLRVPPGVEAVGVDVQDFDLRDPGACLRAVRSVRPDWVLHAAARTDVDGCESDREGAFAVNEAGTRHLASSAREVGAGLLYVSTDFVFDGAKGADYLESDAPNPLSVYGASKLAGERAGAETLDRFAVARTQWLYGPRGKNFVETILAKAASAPELRVVDDQVGSPTSTLALAPALWRLVLAEPRGVYHAVCRGRCSWYGFACAIVEGAGLSTPVRPCATADFPRPARRPAHSSLGGARLSSAIGEAMPEWRDALARYLRERSPVAGAVLGKGGA